MTSLVIPKRYLPFAKAKGWRHRFTKAEKPLAAGAPTPGLREHPGYAAGRAPGGWIYDLVALRKGIVLCWSCQPKFDETSCQYHKDRRFPFVVGKCDGCKQYRGQSKFYIPEELLTGGDFKSRSGMSWLPE